MVENMDGNGTPFHDGERELQERFGLQDKMEAVGRRVVRDHMPEEHQQFFELLPLLFTGLLDTDGHPRASVVTGTPGFVSSPDPRHLTVGAAALPGDPFAENLCAGAAIGLLGLEFHTRRRNRMNGTVVTADEAGFSVEVSQSYGNCPKYIQAREWRAAARPGGSPRVEQTDVMNDAMKSIVSSADTFFIASAHRPEDRSHPSHGVDVSHRGGPRVLSRSRPTALCLFPITSEIFCLIRSVIWQRIPGRVSCLSISRPAIPCNYAEPPGSCGTIPGQKGFPVLSVLCRSFPSRPFGYAMHWVWAGNSSISRRTLPAFYEGVQRPDT